MRKENLDADTQGEFEGTVSFGGHSPFGQERTADPFSQGESGAGNRGSELFTDPGFDSRRIDPGDSGAETKRKRGRPPGSKNAGKSAAKLTGDKLESARRKLTDTLSGVVGFGVSYYGTIRAGKYKKYSLQLAERVYRCYQITKETAVSVGEPLADTFITWFPQYVETTTKAIDPGLAVARMFSILQQASENEKIVVTRYQQQFQAGQPEPPTNGAASPGGEPAWSGVEGTTKNVEETINQWNQGTPSPEEIHPDNQSQPMNYSSETTEFSPSESLQEVS